MRWGSRGCLGSARSSYLPRWSRHGGCLCTLEWFGDCLLCSSQYCLHLLFHQDPFVLKHQEEEKAKSERKMGEGEGHKTYQ